MIQYQARELLKLTPDELWSLPDGPMIVVFDDGPLETTARKTIFSVYLQEYHRLYPKTPLLKDRHHVGNERLSTRTHLRILGDGMWDAYDAYEGKLDIDELCRVAYETTNRLYNDFTYRLESSVVSVNILDFIEVLDHPTVAEANSSVKPYEASITQTHKTIETVLMDPKELRTNPISKAAKSGLVDMGQILQCVGPRGTPTEIDSTIFRQPILVGFVEGMRKLYDSMIESRSAAKALMFTKDPVAESEYFNRKMQLLASTVRRLYGVATVADAVTGAVLNTEALRDCGSKVYRTLRIQSRDLTKMAGKFYLTEDGSLAAIKETDRQLIGKTVQVRSIFDCLNQDREGFCSTCFGELALSIPGITNIGHLCATVLCEMVSQAVLSTKHLDRSSSVDELPIDDFAKRYIRLGSDPNTIGLASNLKGKHIKLILKSDEAKNLSDIAYAKAVKDLPVGRVTEISEVKIVIVGKDKEEEVVVPVSIGSRYSSLNHRMLEYVKIRGWEITETGDYVIDLKEWDHDHVIFELALKHINMVDFMKSIEYTIKAAHAGKTQKTLKDFDDPWAALMELYELVSSKLRVNIAHLEVIIKSTMVVSIEDLDYNIPLAGESFEFGPYEDNIAMRSMSAQFAYQRQMPAIYDVKSYIATDRPPHPLDAMLAGQ